MRNDMKRVIIDCTRDGGGDEYRTPRLDVRTCEEDTSSCREGMKSQYRHNRKGLSDRLNPLTRFLQKQVGRPWNKVYSEIKEHSRGHMGDHVLQHVEDFVYLHATEVDGAYFDQAGRRIYRSDNCFWIKNGILRAIPPYKYDYSKRVGEIRRMDKQEYYCHEGIWYRVRTKPFAVRKHNRMLGEQRIFHVDDEFGMIKPMLVAECGSVGKAYLRHVHDILMELYGSHVTVVWKQQANSREVRKLKAMDKKRAA